MNAQMDLEWGLNPVWKGSLFKNIKIQYSWNFSQIYLDLVFELFLFKSNYLIIQIKIEQMSILQDASLNNCAVFNWNKCAMPKAIFCW